MIKTKKGFSYLLTLTLLLVNISCNKIDDVNMNNDSKRDFWISKEGNLTSFNDTSEIKEVKLQKVKKEFIAKNKIKKVSLDVVNDIIEVYKSLDDKFKIIYEDYEEGDRLYSIEENDHSLNFKYIKKEERSNNQRIIRLYIPDRLDTLSIKGVNGPIAIEEGVGVKDLDIFSVNSNVELVSLDVDSIKVEVTNGEVLIDSKLGVKTNISIVNGRCTMNVLGKKEDFKVRSRNLNTDEGKNSINLNLLNGISDIKFAD